MSAVFPSLPDTPNLSDVFRAHPGAIGPLTALLDAVMRAPGPVGVSERELLAAYVSGLNACAYCHGSHTGFAEALGVPAGLVGALLTDLDTAPIEPRLRPLCRYAKVLTETPRRVTAADAQAVFDAGWGEDALFTVVSVCAVFNMMNWIVEGTGCGVAEGDLARWAGTRFDRYTDWAEGAGLLPAAPSGQPG